MSASPPLPPARLRIGVSGHRPNRLGESDPVLLAEQVRLVLTTIHHAATSANQGGTATIRLLSSLAEGADRLVAAPALDLGYTLEVPLPFPQPDYEQDFQTADSIQDFRSLLARAASVFTLAPPPGDRAYAYRAAGQIVVDHADILLVLWDGKPAQGIGGTPEMIERAQSLGTPVLRIEAAAPHRISFRDEPDPLAALEAHIRALLQPSPAAQRSLESYRRESWPTRLAAASYTFIRLLGDGRWKTPAAPQPADPVPIENLAIIPFFRWTDALASQYGERSRSAALRIQWLATSSVVFGALAIPFADHPAPYRLFTFLEFLTTFLVVLDGVLLARRPWHSRWLLFRSLAEQLRSLDLLAPLARSLAVHQPQGQDPEDDDTSAFASYFLGALVRSLPLPSAEVTPAFLVSRRERLLFVLGDQASFQASTSRRYETLEATLHRFGMFFFIAAAGFAIYDVLHAFNVIRFTSEWIGSFAILLPALGAGLSSTSVQGEYKRLAGRARTLHGTLAQRIQELQSPGPLSLDTLACIASGAADVMTAEVRDWQTLVATRKPSLPV